MKKRFGAALFLIAAAALSIESVCAQEAAAEAEAPQQRKAAFSLELTAGIPIHWTDARNHPEDGKDKYVSQNTALGIAFNIDFSKKAGMFLDIDYSFNRFVGNSSADSGQTNIYHGYDGLFEFNATLGALIYLYSGNYLRIPLGVGIHYYYFIGPDYWWTDVLGGAGSRYWVEGRDHQFGLGAYLGLQYHFTKWVYIFARTNLNFDLFRYHQVKAPGASAGELEIITALSVKPAFGIGIKF